MTTGEIAEREKIKIDYLVSFITNLSAGQRQLTGCALDLQSLALAKKRQIKDVIDRAVELGEIQDIFIKVLREQTNHFVNCINEDDLL